MTRNLFVRPNFLFASIVVLASLSACTGQLEKPNDGSGGAPAATGGAASGGVPGSSGGASSGGAPSGGAPSGGTSSGGAASGGAASGGAASGGDTGAGGSWRDEDFVNIPDGPTFQFVRKVVTSWNINNCTGADCHGGSPAHVSFIPTPDFYERLTTVVSDEICLDENDMPMKLIVPGEPENSAFLRILKEDCENMGRMPGGNCIEGNDCLPASAIANIEQWIADGALNN